MLPNDVARCPGDGGLDETIGEYAWRIGCDDCMRRTSPPGDPERVRMMTPPTIVVFECEFYIPPEGE